MIRKNKGQTTIFVIIAIIIVGVIVVLFVLRSRPTIIVSPDFDPSSYIEGCMKESTEEAINILSEQGGDIISDGSVMYKDKNITYLCYNANFYKPCINQRPMLIEHIEKEINEYLEPRMRTCFSALRQELEERNYVVSLEGMNITTELQNRKVIVTINRGLSMTKEETRRFEKFKTQISHPLYDLAKIAMEISNQEAQYCNFDALSFMLIYSDYDIQKFRTGNSDTIYTLKDLQTNKEFRFAIRSCALPAGL